MEYEITMERTVRFAVTFQAEDNDEAEEKANAIFNAAMEDTDQFEGNDEEFDYALHNLDTGEELVEWEG